MTLPFVDGGCHLFGPAHAAAVVVQGTVCVEPCSLVLEILRQLMHLVPPFLGSMLVNLAIPARNVKCRVFEIEGDPTGAVAVLYGIQAALLQIVVELAHSQSRVEVVRSDQRVLLNLVDGAPVGLVADHDWLAGETARTV